LQVAGDAQPGGRRAQGGFERGGLFPRGRSRGGDEPARQADGGRDARGRCRCGALGRRAGDAGAAALAADAALALGLTMADDKKLTTRAENFSDWYNELVLRAELADYSPVKGSMVIRPNGYGIWERMQRAL